MSAEDVARAMNSTGIAQVIKVEEKKGMLHISHRLLPKTKPRVRDWTRVLGYVLARKNGWEEHVCKRYFLQDGKIRYVWNFIVQWKGSIKDKVYAQLQRDFVQAAKELPRVGHQLSSYPLVGADADRNTPEGPINPLASGPMTGGLSQKGAHITKAR